MQKLDWSRYVRVLPVWLRIIGLTECLGNANPHKSPRRRQPARRVADSTEDDDPKKLFDLEVVGLQVQEDRSGEANSPTTSLNTVTSPAQRVSPLLLLLLSDTTRPGPAGYLQFIAGNRTVKCGIIIQ